MATHQNDESKGRGSNSGHAAKERTTRKQDKLRIEAIHSKTAFQPLPATSLAAVMDKIADGLIALDTSWRCTYVNAAAAEFLKTTPDKMLDAGAEIYLLKNSPAEGLLAAIRRKDS